MYGQVNFWSVYQVRPLTVALASLFLVGCARTECGNRIIAEAISPDAKNVATHFERNCGATTPFVQVVMIRKIGSQFQGDNPESYVFTIQGSHAITVEWPDEDHLIIRRPPLRGDIFKAQPSWNDVQITYAP